MKIQVTYKPDAQDHRRVRVEEFSSNKVTFPPELPYVIIGAFPKVEGRSRSIFLPDIKELVITDR